MLTSGGATSILNTLIYTVFPRGFPVRLDEDADCGRSVEYLHLLELFAATNVCQSP